MEAKYTKNIHVRHKSTDYPLAYGSTICVKKSSLLILVGNIFLCFEQNNHMTNIKFVNSDEIYLTLGIRIQSYTSK